MSLWVCTNPDCGMLTGPNPIPCPKCGAATAFATIHPPLVPQPISLTAQQLGLADPPSAVPATLSSLQDALADIEHAQRYQGAFVNELTLRIKGHLEDAIKAWDARERRIASAEAKVTQLAKDQMMLASAIVTDAEKLSEPMWTPPSLAERAREHGRDAAKLREAEAAREALREFMRGRVTLTESGVTEIHRLLSPVPYKTEGESNV